MIFFFRLQHSRTIIGAKDDIYHEFTNNARSKNGGNNTKKGKYHFTTIVGTNWEATRTTKLVDH